MDTSVSARSGNDSEYLADTSLIEDDRSFCAASFEARREDMSRKNPDLGALVDVLQIPDEFLPGILAHLVRSPGAACMVALGKQLGIPWYAVESYVRDVHKVPAPERVARLFQNPLCRWKASLRPEEEGQIIVLDGAQNPQKIMLFSADFVVNPFPLERWLPGVPRSALCFAAYLPDPEQSLREQLAGSIASQHVYGSLFYLRFYRQGNDFIVTEIQSDQWKRITGRHLKQEVYKDWAKVGVLSFEDYVSACAMGEKARIIFPDSDYVRRRWAKLEGDQATPEAGCYQGISEATLESLYEKLPSDLGYIRQCGERVQTREFRDRKDPLAIENPYIKELKFSSSPPGIVTDISPRSLEGIESYAKLHIPEPGNRTRRKASEFHIEFRDTEGRPLSSRDAAVVVYDFISNVNLPEVPERKRRHKGDPKYFNGDNHTLVVPAKAIELSDVNPLAPELCNVFEEIMKARPVLSESRWTLTSRDTGLIHRFPGVCLYQYAADLMAMIDDSHEEIAVWYRGRLNLQSQSQTYSAWGYKNGRPSLVTISLGGSGCYKIGDLPFSSLEDIFINGHGVTCYDLDYGKFLFAGTPRQEVEERFAALLGMNLLADLQGDELARLLPEPVNAVAFSGAPLVPGERCMRFEATPVNPFGGSNKKQEFAQLATISQCDVRLDTVVRSFVFPALYNEELFESAPMHFGLAPVMQLLYAVAGEECQLPDNSKIAAGSFESVLEYLSEIYSLNKDAAEKVIDKFENAALCLLGSMHGTGGCFSSRVHRKSEAQEFSLGNITGNLWNTPSELGLRSVDITGAAHDFGRGAWMPWVAWGSPPRDESELLMRQRADLEEWATTLYWFKSIMRGEMLPQAELKDYPFGMPGAKTLSPQERRARNSHMWELRQDDNDPLRLVIRNKRLAELYRRFHEKTASSRPGAH